MNNLLNRRQFGKRLVAGTALALVSQDASVAAEAAVQKKADNQWQIAGPGMWKMTTGLPEAITPVTSRLVPPSVEAMRRLPGVQAPIIDAPTSSISRRGVSLVFPLAPYEEIYGFGLQFFSISHRGKKRTIRVNADPGKDTGDSHAPIPFYVSSRGYGVLVDTARYSTFYCGESRPKPTTPVGEMPSGDVPLFTKTLREEDSSQILVEIPTAQGIEAYLFAGPTMLDVVRRYNLFSGGGVLPPEWGLGFWYRAASNATEDEIVAIASEFREREIPCDVMGLEAGWQTHAYSCSFSWDKSRFAHPESLIDDLKRQNFHVNLWEHSFVHPSSHLFKPMQDLAGNTAVWGGLVPDFQDPQARRVFGDFHGKHLIDAGIAGFKLDECDNSDFTGGWSFAEPSQFPSGVDGEQMHNLFGLRYQRALWDQFLERGQETYSLVRSSGALATPYPFVLYSDLYDHRQFVRGLVNSGFSGLLWCPEVRDAKSEADLLRRLQTVVFSPLAMINAWYIKNPPWKQMDRKKNNADQLADNWQSLESRCREIIGWRMQLVPYLLSAFDRYATDGTPPFRALVLDYPDEKNLSSLDDQYMIGDRMMVAPLVAGEADRKIVLPPGTWHDFWTGKVVEGGNTLSVAAGYEKIPVFVKAGSVMPIAAIGASAASPESRQLTVQVYGDGSLPWHLGGEPGRHMELSWSATEHRGKVSQSGSGTGNFNALRWKQMG